MIELHPASTARTLTQPSPGVPGEGEEEYRERGKRKL
jgi:hypothetical protein